MRIISCNWFGKSGYGIYFHAVFEKDCNFESGGTHLIEYGICLIEKVLFQAIITIAWFQYMILVVIILVNWLVF